MPRTKTQTTKPRTARRRRRRSAQPQQRGPTSPDLPARSTTTAKSSRSPSAPVELPRLLTVDEVADLLRTTRRAVYTRIRRGSIPGVVRVSRRLLIDGATLVDWLGKGRAVSLTTQGDQR